jgi:DNA-binding CsgD family transcriptional regulator
LNELILQAESPEHFVGILNVGSILYGHSDANDPDPRRLDPQQAAVEPHLAGLPREIASRQVGSWVSPLFRYQPPILGFSRSEQRLLWAALRGATDDELSDALSISLSAVKKTWRSIYARAMDQLPELIPNQLSEEVLTQDRGKEKKRRLIAYLREHPEELRPFSRRLLQMNSAGPSADRNSSADPASRLRQRPSART